MTKHLLQIHIGPMQVFIAAARRTRDLWFGSWLMSELSKAVARGVADENDANRLIFPAPLQKKDLNPGTSLGVSNKIAALVVNPERAAQAAKDALDKRYDDLIASAGLQSKLGQTWKLANKQLHSFLEFYWVSYLENNDYPRARAYADALLAARKNSRTFQPISWNGAGLPKSSLDGRMETVIPPKLSAGKMYSQFRARPGEQLSGVDLLKRLGEAENEKSRFPSTSHMAAMPLKARLQAKANDPEARQKWEAYLKALRKENSDIEKQEIVYHDLKLPFLGTDEKPLDGSLLFESRLLDFVDKSKTRPLKEKLKAFLREILQDAEVSAPIPYYALLVADGDSMGEAINNIVKDSNRPGEKRHKDHQAFSQQLAAFSEQARKIVENGGGAVVYAGGDDVLALLPLDTAVATTGALAQKFCKMMNGLTFSAGIAIVHHLEPLEDALELARKAEKEAKSLDGKNALAVILNKRSGTPRMIVGRWGEIDGRLAQFVAHYRQKELPKGLAYQLRDMFLHLGGQTAVKNNAALQAVIAKEAKRIITRKEGSDAAAADVVAAVQQLDHDKTTIETLSGELIIAAHIAQAQELAQQEIAQQEEIV